MTMSITPTPQTRKTRKPAAPIFSTLGIHKTDMPLLASLAELYAGGNRAGYVRALLKREACPHPKNLRVALSATYMADSSAIKADSDSIVTLRGFYCKRCRQYILPAPVEM